MRPLTYSTFNHERPRMSADDKVSSRSVILDNRVRIVVSAKPCALPMPTSTSDSGTAVQR